MTEPKSRTIELLVDGEPMAEFIVDRLSVQITRHEVIIRGDCRDTYEDKVLLNAETLEQLGYQPDGSDIPLPVKPWWRRLQAAALSAVGITPEDQQ